MNYEIDYNVYGGEFPYVREYKSCSLCLVVSLQKSEALVLKIRDIFEGRSAQQIRGSGDSSPMEF